MIFKVSFILRFCGAQVILITEQFYEGKAALHIRRLRYLELYLPEKALKILFFKELFKRHKLGLPLNITYVVASFA